jgi:hypothetical protein
MIDGIRRYFRVQVIPRWASVLGGSEFVVAVLAATLFGVFADHTGLAGAKVGDVGTALLAYAAVAFGFSIAGLTIALTIPNEKFVSKLATTEHSSPVNERRGTWTRRLKPKNANAYSDLLFVFSWTAWSHWTLVVASFGFLAACGFDAVLLPPSPTLLHRVLTSLLVFLAVYALSLFLVTLITLTQVGAVYIRDLRDSEL